MKVFVTGATGFIGNHLIRRLIDENYEVVCSGRSLSKLGNVISKVKALYLDIEDGRALKRALSQEEPDILFHCAAFVENRLPKRLFSTNVEGTRNVLNECLENKIKKIVYLSSVSVISGNPQSPLTDDLPLSATNQYGESKIEAERLAVAYRKKGLKIAILRPCMVYGEDEPHLLALLVKLIRWRLLPILGSGKNKLQLVDVENVVDVMMLCLLKEEAFEGTYIVADKEALSTKELFGYIAEAIGAKVPLQIPSSLIPLLTHLPVIGKNFSLLLKDRTYSVERLKEKLGYVPRISVYEGIKRSVLALSARRDRSD